METLHVTTATLLRRILRDYQLRGARQAAGVSVRQLAWYLGVSERTIRDWEHGRRPVPPSACYALSRTGLWRDLLVMNGVRPATWSESFFWKRRRWLEREGAPKGLLRPVRDG